MAVKQIKKFLKSQRFLSVFFSLIGLVLLLVVCWQLYLFQNATENFKNIENQTFLRESNFSSQRRPASGWQLFIEKLDIKDLPIALDVDGNNEEEYYKALEGGVAHYKGTAYPGKKGNCFIFGHSEYYWDKPGDYKQIFKNLNQLEEGDQIRIKSDKKEYQYIVSETKIVGPKDITVLSQTKDYRLTLMTCWPPGSTAQRLVVVAEKAE